MIALLILLAVPDLSGILRLSSDGSVACACPISMDQALTSKHVTSKANQWIWGLEDGETFHGIAEGASFSPFRDLAIISAASEERFPKWYQRAVNAPQIGDRIWFVGFDWSNRKKAFAIRVFEGRVSQIFNGQLVFDSPGEGGSSGSCILNDAGQIVAINAGGKELNDKTESGVGIGVWGSWFTLKKDEPTVEEPQPYFEVQE